MEELTWSRESSEEAAALDSSGRRLSITQLHTSRRKTQLRLVNFILPGVYTAYRTVHRRKLGA